MFKIIYILFYYDSLQYYNNMIIILIKEIDVNLYNIRKCLQVSIFDLFGELSVYFDRIAQNKKHFFVLANCRLGRLCSFAKLT